MVATYSTFDTVIAVMAPTEATPLIAESISWSSNLIGEDVHANNGIYCGHRVPNKDIKLMQ